MTLFRLKSSSPTYLAILITALVISGCDNQQAAAPQQSATANKQGYAGSQVCGDCHTAETQNWQNSHHDLAMQVASPATALGDFNDSRFEHNGLSTRFYSEGDQLYVETDGPDGKLDSFPVRYAFGVYPLQQYLLELPDTNIQALSIAWDSRPADQGGQRWFHLYGEEAIDHTDVLHWTKPSQNWETMCADCHSTNLTSSFDTETRTFETNWAELNVGCEACHGPAETHVNWARSGADPGVNDKGLDLRFTERTDINWALDTETGNSKRSAPRNTDIEITACAGCHSRRSRIAEGNHPATDVLDNFSPALIQPPLYHRDGQILDEVYVYGSFMQSKMQMAGVTCSDCHDPHSLELRAPGPAVCLQCHASETFATTEHQLHKTGVADCLDCHMPETTYMQVDPRRDHSFRIPRPQLTEAFNIPNACGSCHADKDAAWATAAIASKATEPHWSEALAATGPNNQTSMQLLSRLAEDRTVPPIIRASAASRLTLGDASGSQDLLERLLSSDEALVRWGATRALLNSDPALTARFGPALLKDPVRSVRLAAAESLARIDPLLLPRGNYAAIQAGLDEYRASQQLNSERSEAHVNIANMERSQGQFDKAEREYLLAITLNPSFVPGYVNLSDLYREWNREADSEAILRQGLAAEPGQPALHHSLGLSLIRQQRVQEALEELRIAAESVDATPRYALVYAVALEGTGQADAAIAYLEQSVSRFDSDPQLTAALEEFKNRQP